MALAKPGFLAFKLESPGGLLRALQSECGVCAAFDPATTPPASRPPLAKFMALWDTGATGCVVTTAVVNACGLKPIGMQKVIGAYGGVTDRETYLVNLMLPNKVGVSQVTVVHGDLAGTDILIGMDIITLGDFAITNQGGRTLFTFRIPSLHTIDYVKQANHLTATAAGTHGGMAVNPLLRKAKRHK